MKPMLLGVVTFMVLSAKSFAESECTSLPTNYNALVDCAESRSPDIQASKLEVDTARKQIEAAGQWRNPELAAETFRGKVGGESRSETDISLGVPIELGGRISARIAVAKSDVSLADARLYEARVKTRTEMLLKLHRLRQVLHEQEIVDEAVETFSKLIRQYSNRPGLSPEQKVSVAVFQLSKSEYELKRNANLDEQLSLDSYFKLTTGFGVEQIKKLVPATPKLWPSFEPKQNPQLSAKQQLLQAQVDAAKAELQVAKSESWPTLTLGPSVKLVEESRASDQLVGFNVSLPIPVFNANGKGRSAASANLQASEARQQFGLREQDLQREELLKVYQQSVKSLSSSLSHAEIEERHKNSEQLFVRGLVPSSLVIEAHRTSLELESARHERELKALEALMGLYALEGTILENNL